jgi:hypothetical protein
MSELGPVQVVVVKFTEESDFQGRVLAELQRLEGESTIRVLDLLFIAADADSGELVVLDFQSPALGGIIGSMLGLGEIEPRTWEGGSATTDVAYGLSVGEIQSIARSLEPGTEAAIMLVEHIWARGFKRAVRETGGRVDAEAFLSEDALFELAAHMAGIDDEMESIRRELEE